MAISKVDASDDRIAVYRNLSHAKSSSAAGLFVAEGRWLVERLLSSNLTTLSVLATEPHVAELEKLTPSSVPIYCATRQTIDQIVGFNFHRGVLACGERPANACLSQFELQHQHRSMVVVCAEVADPVNLGGIIRNACAFGASGLIVSAKAADPYSRRSIRVSMGSAFRLPIRISSDLPRDLTELKTQQCRELIATVLDDQAEPLEAAQRAEHIALIFGGEGHGLNRELISLANRRVTLPMSFETDSLNVASSTAIFLYHFSRVANWTAPCKRQPEA